MNPHDLETINAAAARHHVSRRTIQRRISEGAITAYKFGPRLVRLDPAEVDALLYRVSVDETRIQRVMRVVQRDRICTPGSCPFCRERAEAIIAADNAGGIA